VSEPAVSLAFFDAAQGIHGSARSGVTLLFEGSSPRTLSEGAEIERAGDAWRARADGQLELEFTPVSEQAHLGGSATAVCRVAGSVGDTTLDCLGTATETETPPEWAELDALRAISAIFDAEHAVLATARRPRGALGHGHEQIDARLLQAGQLLEVEDARVSTVYDGDGRQRSAGLELWLPGEDFPRRASGTVQAGASLTLEGLQVNASIFAWTMEGREGAGAYDLLVRDEPDEAA
jgi:hypothetical protein